MGFHLGKPIATMIALACGAGLLSRFTSHTSQRADVELWTFADSHRREYGGADLPAGVPSPLERFTAQTGLSADVKLIQQRAMNTRLSALILGDVRGAELPDVVELEISSVGRFFGPPVDRVGFLPLNDLLARDGWRDKIVESRLAAWSKGGQIFGVPGDVHPTMIAYNDELFRAAGVDLAASETWDQFIDNCLRAQRAWREQGVRDRWALELPRNSSGWLVTMLLERGVSLIDADGGLRITDERVLNTLVTYCEMSVGDRRIGAQPSEGNQSYALDMNGGTLAAMIAPDWRVKYLRDYAPSLAGKMRVMPMPRWPDSPYRTSTWGGTAIAIPRNAPDPEKSWRLIESLYLGGGSAPSRNSYKLSAVRTHWANDPLRDEHDAFYSGQQVRKLIADLADEVPPRYVSPASTYAEVALAQVLIDAIGRTRRPGDEAEFRAYCAEQLAAADRMVRARIEHGEPPR